MSDQPFGSYAPDWRVSALLGLTRHTWFGRGKLRKLAAGMLKSMVTGPLDVSFFGNKARLHALDNHPETKAILNPRHFAPSEFAFCRSVLPADNGIFVDVGANAGLFSLYAASVLKTGTIVSIEPMPVLFERLSVNLLHFHSPYTDRVRICPVNCAVGSEPGWLELSVPEQLGQASIHPIAGAKPLRVPARPLLDIIQEAGIERIDVLKIDIEGFEDQALGPFFNTAPEQVWPEGIILEHCHSGRWKSDIRQDLVARGYEIARIDNTNTMLRRKRA